jgi:hypothetical protein
MKMQSTCCRLAMIVAVSLAGCASQQAPVSAPPQSLTTENSASVVVYRPSTSFHRFNPELPYLYVNDQRVGKLAIGSALTVRIPAGDNALAVKESVLFMPAYESHRLTLKAEAGKTYFVRYAREFGGVLPVGGAQVLSTSGFDVVPDDVGRQRR